MSLRTYGFQGGAPQDAAAAGAKRRFDTGKAAEAVVDTAVTEVGKDGSTSNWLKYDYLFKRGEGDKSTKWYCLVLGCGADGSNDSKGRGSSNAFAHAVSKHLPAFNHHHMVELYPRLKEMVEKKLTLISSAAEKDGRSMTAIVDAAGIRRSGDLSPAAQVEGLQRQVGAFAVVLAEAAAASGLPCGASMLTFSSRLVRFFYPGFPVPAASTVATKFRELYHRTVKDGGEIIVKDFEPHGFKAYGSFIVAGCSDGVSASETPRCDGYHLVTTATMDITPRDGWELRHATEAIKYVPNKHSSEELCAVVQNVLCNSGHACSPEVAAAMPKRPLVMVGMHTTDSGSNAIGSTKLLTEKWRQAMHPRVHALDRDVLSLQGACCLHQLMNTLKRVESEANSTSLTDAAADAMIKLGLCCAYFRSLFVHARRRLERLEKMCISLGIPFRALPLVGQTRWLSRERLWAATLGMAPAFLALNSDHIDFPGNAQEKAVKILEFK